MKGSDYLGDQDAIQILCDEAAADLYQLEHWGAVFSRTEDGRIAQRPFGAAGVKRTAYAADITGDVLIKTLYEQVVRRGIRVYEEYFGLEARRGRRAVRRGDRLEPLAPAGLVGLSAKAVILATGRSRFACTSGPRMRTRAPVTAWRWHWRVGVPLKDMEMMQFHPTTLAPTGVLITEGCRGEGAFLLNAERRAFSEELRAVCDGARLARRDLLRAEQTGDRRGPRARRKRAARPAPPRGRADSRKASRHAGAVDGSSAFTDLRADPRQARRPLPHGRRRYGRRLDTSTKIAVIAARPNSQPARKARPVGRGRGVCSTSTAGMIDSGESATTTPAEWFEQH